MPVLPLHPTLHWLSCIPAVDMLRTAKDVKAKLKADDQSFKPFMGKVRRGGR